jgi:ribosome recycling factor
MPAIGEARERMDKSVEAVRREFGSVRSGKATPALLDTVRVEAYGSKMSLTQVASISAPEPRMILVQPWDKSLLHEVERGIQSADLGLNPSNDGNVVRVPIPALTEERRKDLVKVLHRLAEEGRVAVRQARQDANKSIKHRQSKHEIGEDEAHREMDEVQKLTDAHIKKIDDLLAHKEEEVMEV